MIKPTGGIARISALTTHQIASGWPRRLASRPLTAKIIPATTLTIATDSAIRPRLKHPRTSTGVDATRKNAAGARAGRRIWRRVRVIGIDELVWGTWKINLNNPTFFEYAVVARVVEGFKWQAAAESQPNGRHTAHMSHFEAGLRLLSTGCLIVRV